MIESFSTGIASLSLSLSLSSLLSLPLSSLSLSSQVLGDSLPGNCTDYQAIPGKGLSCTVHSVSPLKEDIDKNISNTTTSKVKRLELVSASKAIEGNEEYKVSCFLVLLWFSVCVFE